MAKKLDAPREIGKLTPEELRELSAKQLMELAHAEQTRWERWRVTVPVLIIIALWWLLFLADTWGWVNWSWLHRFFDLVFPSEEIIRARQGG